MPVVRRHPGQQVATRPLPRPQTGPLPTAETYGAGIGRAIEGVGDTITRVGSHFGAQLAQEAEEARRQADRIAALKADSDLFEATAPIRSQALSVTGQEALGWQEKVRPEFDKRASEIAAKLTNDRQRLEFEARRVSRWQSLYGTLESHGAQEFQQWRAAEVDRGIKNRVSDGIAQASDPREVARLDAEGRAIIADQKLGPEATQAALESFHTALYGGIVDNLLTAGNDKAAKAYYDQTKGLMTGEALAKIEKALESATVEGDALRASENLWVQHGGKLAEMETAAREQFKDDPKRLKATIGFLRERRQGLELAEKDATEQALGNLWQQVAQGVSLREIVRTPEYRNAPAKAQLAVKDYIQSQADRIAARAASEESRAAARESRAYTREQRAEQQRENEGLYMYYQYSNPDVQAKMTDAQVWALVPTIGRDNVAKLLKQRHEYKTNPAAVDDFRSDEQVLGSVLRGSGIDPTPKDDDKPGQAKIGWFREQVAAEQRRVQGVTKKKLTNEELAIIAKRIVGQQVIDRGWFTNSTKSVMHATIKDVPKKDYADIKNEFVKRGVANPTDEQILSTWLDVQAGKK